jgi:hypothetical protein
MASREGRYVREGWREADEDKFKIKIKFKMRRRRSLGTEGWNIGNRIWDMGRIKREVEGGRGQVVEEER